MAMYIFYLFNRGGGAISLEAFDLASDDDADERALTMLDQHPSCAYVAVWEDERAVLKRHRSRSDRSRISLGSISSGA
jgi:hypothetical protein